VVHVFQPFEVTHSHTTSIAQNIRQKLNASAEKNLFSLNGRWSIGCLNNKFAVEFVSVFSVD
jgi:hypothetical protein